MAPSALVMLSPMTSRRSCFCASGRNSPSARRPCTSRQHASSVGMACTSRKIAMWWTRSGLSPRRIGTSERPFAKGKRATCAPLSTTLIHCSYIEKSVSTSSASSVPRKFISNPDADQKSGSGWRCSETRPRTATFARLPDGNGSKHLYSSSDGISSGFSLARRAWIGKRFLTKLSTNFQRKRAHSGNNSTRSSKEVKAR